jgi:hypothetical protein
MKMIMETESEEQSLLSLLVLPATSFSLPLFFSYARYLYTEFSLGSLSRYSLSINDSILFLMSLF